MIRKLANKEVSLPAFGILLASIIAVPLWTLYQQTLNANVLYLMSSAGYMLAGERMSDAYYDTNPPLSIILYIPPALLVKYTAISVSQAVYLYCISALCLGLHLLNQALKNHSNITTEQKAILFTSFLFVHTIIALFYWGEREYFISLTIIPFIFTQISITKKTNKNSPASHLILAMGSFFIMIKPHYYIIPALILLHRFATQKRLSIAWDKDSLYLCGFAFTYAVTLYFFFYDYLTVILPDVLNLYLTLRTDWVTDVTIGALGVTAITILITSLMIKEKKQKNIISLMFILFIISMVPYYLQGKGYLNHLIIPFNFFLCGLNLLIFYIYQRIVRDFIPHKNNIHSPLALITTVITFAVLLYKIVVFTNTQTTHDKYQNLNLVKTLQEISCNKKPCSFFMFNDSLEITHQLALYSGLSHASRFPSYWFLPILIGKNNESLSDKRKKTLARKYAFMAYEDLKKFKPNILLIGKFNEPTTEKTFDIIEFLSQNSSEFAQYISRYQYERTVKIKQADYIIDGGFGDKVVEYDIYKIKKIGHKDKQGE